jgi:hypothetical protein
MAEISSVGSNINRLMDAIGFNDSIGDAVGAIVDLQRGDKAGFIKNMNDLYDDVNKFLEKKLLGKNFLGKIAKYATVPLKKSTGLKKAVKLLAPLVKKFANFKAVGFLNPQLMASGILLSKILDMAKNLKGVSTGDSKNIQHLQQATPDSANVQNATTNTGISQKSTSQTGGGVNFTIKSPGNIEERIMLALTGSLKENRDEMENLLKDIEKLGSKTNMTDKDKNDLQVLQIKLQVSISRRNEMVNTLSNIMKTFNEMNMATIRNIRM